MSVVKWQFQESPVGIRENEQIGEEFFSNAEVLSEVSGVVRESIQNSLDEVFDSTKPIHMVFTVGRQSPDVANRYFQDLYPHLTAIAMREMPNFTEQSQFLVIEDFNTRGLEGPTTPIAPSDEALIDAKPIYKHSFWFFEWKTGESDKGSGNRGSWGVGKIVFPRASRIKSHLVLSSRRAEASPNGDTSILFGHSILKFRSIGGKRFVPDCQWMIKDEQNMSIPSADAVAQAQFIKDWKLTRQIGELGTSIVVPFCRENMNLKNLVQSIIRDYFISILGGQLVCKVSDDNGNNIEINKNTIVSLIEEEFGDENISRRVRSATELNILCGMFVAHEAGSTVKVAIPGNTAKVNDWSEITFSPEESERLGQAYNNGQVIELSVETAVPEMLNPHLEKSTDAFTVLLKKVMEMRGSTVFCREGILIPAANTASLLQNCVSMVIVGSMSSAGTVENSLANLLKNAEGPSHEKWSPSATKFKGLYKPKKSADAAIGWVKQSAERCLRLIQGAENAEDDTTLSTYFPFSNDDGLNPGTAKVVLVGRRDPGDPTKALLAWRAEGFIPNGWELKRISPTEKSIEVGVDAIGKTSTLLDLGDDAVYRFQMVMTDGNKQVASNIVVISPDTPTPPTPLPRRAKIEIKKLGSGFAIVAINGEKLPKNYRFTVRVKYDSRGGKSPWTKEDFLLADQLISKKTKGLTIINATDNYVLFELTNSDIYAEWQGFDKLRDLDVAATEEG
jgi:hypothetical protein